MPEGSTDRRTTQEQVNDYKAGLERERQQKIPLHQRLILLLKEAGKHVSDILGSNPPKWE